jgi:hypothetical protein
VATERDAVDAILDQWAAERPDVDVSAIAVGLRASSVPGTRPRERAHLLRHRVPGT